ncbi:MAG: response regulator [Bdellovibrionales bacterium]|nr:response regulator [Bdellovibrionales bacterium]
MLTNFNNPLHILLIEDNPQHRKIVYRLLSGLPEFQLHHADNLHDGLIEIRKQNISLILLDLNLPDSRRDETFERTFADASEIPIVVLSSQLDAEFAKNLVNKGAQDFLVKSSLSQEILIRTINFAYERKKINEELKKQNVLNQSLTQISKKGLVNFDIEFFFEEVLTAISKSVTVDAIAILRHEPDSKKFVPIRTFGINLRKNKNIQVGKLKVFDIPPLKWDFPIHSALNISIDGKNKQEPFGVLGIYSGKKKIFSQSEQFYLNSIADVIAASVQRYYLEARLKKKVKDLDEAHRKKNEFLSILSHELRTPLSVVTNSLELLKKFPDNKERNLELIKLIERNVSQEVKLVDDILDTSRIISGRMKIVKSNFYINSLVDSVVDSFSFAANEKNITIESDGFSKEIICYGDKDRIQQVFCNLLGNAIKFTEDNGKIKVHNSVHESYFTLAVEDDGIGIDPDKLPYIFDKFWQVDGSFTRKNQGLGLGLAISKHIVETHNGTLSCDSKGIHKGCTFTVDLPIVVRVDKAQKKYDKLPVPSSSNDPVPTQDSTSGLLDGIRIMLIDDSVDGLQIFKYCLESASAKISAFESAVEAFEQFETDPNQYDLILSDIGLPVMDGYQFIKKVRDFEKKERREKKIPAAALTAFARDSDAEKAQSSGFDIHIKKPIPSAMLVDTVSKLYRASH